MNRRQFLQTGSVVGAQALLLPKWAAAQSPAPALPPSGSDGWVSLLNGRDLSGWYTMLQKSGRGAAEKKGMVTVEEGMLHIMGNQAGPEPAEPGYLATEQEFENVHVRLEFKWGVKRFAPRNYTKRDNGLLYGVVGEDTVWPTCVELQIEEGDVGDYFMIGTRATQDQHLAGLFGGGLTSKGWSNPPVPMATNLPDVNLGEPGKVNITRKIKDGNFEVLNDWNVVELIWQGDRSAHIVNGRTVNAASHLEQPDPHNRDQFIPLTRGKLAIEIEFAEIWFRRFEVKALA